jgi:hypothetical protein
MAANKRRWLRAELEDVLPALPEAVSGVGTNMARCLLYTNLNTFLFMKHLIDKPHFNNFLESKFVKSKFTTPKLC